MSQKEIEMAVNSLCLAGHYSTLFRIIKNIPGAYQVLSSDQTAEAKRQKLLKLLKIKPIGGKDGKEH